MADTQDTIESLEERLEKDSSGSVKKEAMDFLAEQAGILKAELNKGLPEEEANIVKGLAGAAENAQAVIGAVWKRYHEQ